MAPNTFLSDPALQDQNPPSASASPLPSITPQRPTLPFPCRKSVRITMYSILGAFALLMIAWGVVPSYLDPTFEQHIQDQDVIAGMTRNQAIAAWGSPYQMNVTYTNRGIRREEWIYEDWIDAGLVRHRYLYFEEGILVGGWSY